MTHYYGIYLTFIIIISVISSYLILRTRYSKSTFLSLSLFIHRYGIFVPKIMRSIQVSLIIIPIYTIAILIELISKVPKSQRTTKEIIHHAVREYRKDTFVKWMSILLITDTISLIWADSLLLGIIGILTRILMFLTAFNIYVALKISQKHINAIIAGVSIGIMLNTFFAILQRIDCIKNSCTTFFYIEQKVLNIRGLSLTQQGLHIGDYFFPRTIGLFGDVNMHSFFINACIILLLGVLLSVLFSVKTHKNNKVKMSLLLIFLMLIALICSITSISRSAIMGAIIPTLYIVVFFIVSESIKRKSLKPILIASIIVASLTFLTMIGYKKVINNEKVDNNVQSFISSRLNIEKDGSALQHFILIKNALRVGNEATFGWGTGIGNYHNFYNKYIDQIAENTDPHSWFALLFAEQGWSGLIVYISFFAYYIFWSIITSIRNIKKTDYISLCIKFIPLSFIVGMIYYYGFFTPMVWFWFGLAMFYIESDKKRYNLSLNNVIVFILIAFITIYQKLFSFDHAFWANPDKFRICIYHPSCSEYMKVSLQKKGVIKGIISGTFRIIRCNPFSEGGFDPVK